ncbi:uncharacterized protein ATC70_006189 [Mucor velutinosus]|uniref:WRKY domain-containing protein n=1 Tax=Mucor velutinosus TaxID=708070 RepID=A0AAN7HQF4_9FUNG|nr:hypothetical protein ATC70_006189 [Mucor velutinosus]
MEKGFHLQKSTISQKQSNISDRDPSLFSNNINTSLPTEHSANGTSMYGYQAGSPKLELESNYSRTLLKKAFASQSPVPYQLHNAQHCIPENQEELISHTFDLHDVIQRYGDQPEVLGLILSSKVEEDRRKAEEARLRQKELEYLILSKRDSIAMQTNLNRNASFMDTSNSQTETSRAIAFNGKGKARQSLSSNDNKYFRSSANESIESPYATAAKDTQMSNNQEQLFGVEAKRKREANPTYQLSDSSDYFSSAYLAVTQPESAATRDKRHGSISQLRSPNKSAAGSPSEVISHQLQTRDHLYSRRDSNNYTPTLPRSPYEEKPFLDTIGTNTLPPINVSLQSHGRRAESPMSTSHKDDPPSTNLPKRFKNITTLDSFEASILETLPFDNTSDRSSESLQDERRSSVPTERYSGNKRSSITLNQQRSISLDDNSSKAKIHNSIGGPSDVPKKLLLPPNNRPTKPICPDLINRPRRRRREMQAISMIIETREFPYNDEYVWKNNGNTIHKNTGQKSIYYKCSNSMMGCPVNKTVTFRDNGEYLIKYRGNHLDDCNKIKRVVSI